MGAHEARRLVEENEDPLGMVQGFAIHEHVGRTHLEAVFAGRLPADLDASLADQGANRAP
jgi:hypothetical protein